MRLSDINIMYIGKYDMLFPSHWYNCYEVPKPRRANINSAFKITKEEKYAYQNYEANQIFPIAITIAKHYYIDNIEVDEKTWNDVFKTMSKRIQDVTGSKPKYSAVNDTDGTTTIQFITDDLQGRRATVTIFDDLYINEEAINECVKNFLNLKGDNGMKNLTITNYKYNPETKTTTIWWSDKSQSSVTADSDTEANEFTGFCAACAKKLFGNKSTYLNQFDKWTVKIPERERLAAEKKAKEDKEREKAKAKKAAKKAERRAKREVELLAKEFADNYKHESVWEQAKKLAMKKYGVPADYFLDERYNCHCGCKEFDVMDEDENNISD